MSCRIANSLCLCAFVAVLAGPAWAQTPSPTAFVRADDEKPLTDIQLLGKRIFEDANLSEPRGMSCMSCHAPKHAFQGNNHSPVAAIAATGEWLLPWKACFGAWQDLHDMPRGSDRLASSKMRLPTN